MRADPDAQCAPPLLAMLGGAMLAAAAAFALIASPYYPTRQLAGIFLNATSQALDQSARADTRVIGLGSSLLLMATPSRARGQDPAQGEMNWARITKYGWGLGSLDPSLALLEHTPPDILVIDSNLLMRDAETTLDMLRANVATAARSMATLIGASPDPHLRDQRAEQTQDRPCLHLANPTEAALTRYQQTINLAYARGPDEQVAARMARLAARGVRVMIVDVARSRGVEVATAAEKQRWFARLRTLLPPTATLSYHAAPSYSERALYCDGIHLNPAGGKLFQEWWWNQLRQVQNRGR